VYDMYSWDQPASPADEQADARPADKPAPAAPAEHERAARAVQVALDRRDNGGDANPGRPA
jgi:hypothetical protein